MVNNVSNRGERLLKEQNKERLPREFVLFGCWNTYQKMEEYMWNIQNVTKAYALNGLSTRFQFFFSLGVVLPSDSSYRTDLADLCDFKFK